MKKRILSIALAFALVAGSVSLPPSGTPHTVQAAEETDRNNFDYADGKITGYKGTADIVDLTTIFGEEVTEIAEAAFAGNERLTKIVIPKSVTAIHLNAFHSCSALTTVEFEEGSQLTTIAAGAFAETKLKSIHIPGTVVALGANEKKTEKSTDKSIGHSSHNCGTFHKCENLAEVIFEEGTEQLTLSAEENNFDTGGDFSECSQLSSIAFPDRVKSIPPAECYKASSLSFVEFPDGLTEIGEKAFYQTKLAKITVSGKSEDGVTFPSSLETIGDKAFYQTAIGGTITFPESVDAIGASAFSFTNVIDVTFSAPNISLKNSCFYGCNALLAARFLGEASFSNVDVFPRNTSGSSNKNCIIYAYQDKGNTIRSTCDANQWKFNYSAKSIEITSEPSTTKYTYGDNLDSTGMELLVKALKSDGTTEDVEIKGVDLGSCQFSGYQPEVAGPQEVTVTYGGKTDTFTVAVRYDLSKLSSSEVKETYAYTGDPIVPKPEDLKVVYKGKTVPTDCYEVTASNNVDAGYANYTISASKEDWAVYKYTGGSFQIEPRDLSDENVSVTMDPESLDYTGGECKPKVSVSYTNPNGRTLTLTEGTDYDMSYSSDLINAGEVTVSLSGKGNYTGYKRATYRINALDISAENSGVEISAIKDQTYTGSALTPSLEIVHHKSSGEDYRLQKGTDYDTIYSNNTKIGEATVKVVGKGNYTGELTASFQIQPIDIGSDVLTLPEWEDQDYTGEAIKPSVAIYWKTSGERLVEDEDYTYSFSGSAVDEDGKITGWGTVQVKIEGKGIFGGTVTREFHVIGNLEEAKIEEIPSQMYTGEKICPELIVTYHGHALEEGKDYIAKYYQNIEEGTAEVRVEGTGVFQGNQTLYFTIYNPGSIEHATIEEIPNQNFTGAAIEPEVKVSFTDTGIVLKAGEDYEVTYQDNRNAGTATVIVTGIGEYMGTQRAAFRILPAGLTGAKIDAIADLTETGGALTPEVTVTAADGTVLVKEADYTVSYINNVSPGTATVTVTGKGNYTGTLTATFTILAKAPDQTQQNTQPTTSPNGTDINQNNSTEKDDDADKDDDEKKDNNSVKKQKITVRTLTQKIKAVKVRKKTMTFTIKASAKGKLTYKKVSGNKKLTVSKTGKVKVKKKTGRGTYKIKVKITAAAKGNYAKTSVIKTIKVVIS